MEKSKVYFCDMHASESEPLPNKLKRLVKTAGFEQIDFKGKYVAIKIHFGEPGNLAYLRPNYARVICDYVKELGGKPFLTDCNTLYVGGRKNGLDHLDSAYTNGYNPFATGVHTIIADGIKGGNEVYVPVVGGEYVKEAKIGAAIMEADIVISLNHFKGHEMAGFGGALKNLGMGSGSRAGKMEMHNAGKPFVREHLCIGCGKCFQICAHAAPTFKNKIATIDNDKCVGCGRCIAVCPTDAVFVNWDESADVLNCKIAEYAKAVVDGRPNFHINLLIDVSPCCDCHAENDVPIIPDVGMFASFDPIAIDMACAEIANMQPPMPDSVAFDKDKFHGGHHDRHHGGHHGGNGDGCGCGEHKHGDGCCGKNEHAGEHDGCGCGHGEHHHGGHHHDEHHQGGNDGCGCGRGEHECRHSEEGHHHHHHPHHPHPHGGKMHDHFKHIAPGTNWISQIEHGEKLGMGTREYEIVEI